MSEFDIIRAWKDKAYRNSLSADELAQLPQHPAGAIELTDDELTNVDGASIILPITIVCTIACTLTCPNTVPTYCTGYCPSLIPTYIVCCSAPNA